MTTHQDLSAGATLQGGKYRIERTLGQGGFGITYLAHHTLLDQRMAVKEFFPKNFSERDGATGNVSIFATSANKVVLEKMRKKFLEEGRALYKMSHPGIVRVTDIFEEHSTAYYAMEYIPGQSLASILKERVMLPEAEAVGYVRQVCDALGYVHSLNRLHLDINPNNIMVAPDGRPILIDFGASKHYDEATGKNDSTLLGIQTKGYAPIEQVSRSFTTFSPATDIYALGATLYKLLVGVTPPEASVVLNDGLPPRPAHVTAATWAAVAAAMQPRRDRRPQSVAAWLALLPNPADLQPVVSDSTDPAPQPSPQPTGSYNGHEYVDLGLSVKWAICNVGASSPEEAGDYYAWGEISTKPEYTIYNCKTFGKSLRDIARVPSYDVARAKWGGSWRLPTKKELEELRDKCEWRWATYDGKKGYLVKSKTNGNSIFLPAAGWRHGTLPNNFGERGHYWSSTPYGSEIAFFLYFCSSGRSVYGSYRLNGRTVRPVAE